MRADVVVEDWARWIAQDKSGEWWQYENEPTQYIKLWRRNGGDIKFLCHGIPPKDFTQELYEWK